MRAKMLFLVNLLKKHKRRAVFTVFCSSLTSETLFFAFFSFRLRAKASFHRFLLFACKRNAVFPVFCISLASESQFSPFFALRLRAKASFLCFLSVACKRNAVFRVFCISLASDGQFFLFFVQPWRIHCPPRAYSKAPIEAPSKRLYSSTFMMLSVKPILYAI